MSSRARRQALRVADHPAVDDIGQTAFQTPHRFPARLALRQSPPVVGTAGCVMTELDDGHHVQHPIDPAVSRPRQPVPTTITRRRLQRCGSVPGREPPLVGEPADITDVTQQPGGAGRAVPEQLQHGSSSATHHKSPDTDRELLDQAPVCLPPQFAQLISGGVTGR